MHLNTQLVQLVLIPVGLVVLNSLLAAALSVKQNPNKNLSIAGLWGVAVSAFEALSAAAEVSALPLVSGLGVAFAQGFTTGTVAQVAAGVVVAFIAALTKDALVEIKTTAEALFA